MKKRFTDDDLMSAKEFAAIGTTPGQGCKYIQRFAIVPGRIYLICCRVSNGERKANLGDQERNLWHQVTSRGGIAVVLQYDSFRVGSGTDCGWLSTLTCTAKHLGATLLAESTDRFIRNCYFNPKHERDCQLRATDAELRELVRYTDGVPLMTWLDPDMPLNEVRRHQTKRGQQAKGHRGGRPRNQTPGYKLRRRQLWLPRVRKLHRQGKSLGEIAKETGLPKTVVWEWTQ